MCAAASLMLGLMHLSFWLLGGRALVYMLSALMAFAAGAGALLELAMMRAESVAVYSALIRWQNLAVFFILIPMVWLVYAQFGTARRWLVLTITALWVLVLVINFLSPASVVFREITELRPAPTFWGEFFTTAVGTSNPWVHLANVASLLILVYIVDASVRAWRRGKRRRAGLVGGASSLFILSAGVHAPLVDAGRVATPFMVSVAFLTIVSALSYQLADDASRALRYGREIRAGERRWRTLLNEVQLVVVDLDPAGRVRYVNPFFERLSGRGAREVVGQPVTALMVAEEAGDLAARFAAAASEGPRPRSRWTVATCLCRAKVQRKSRRAATGNPPSWRCYWPRASPGCSTSSCSPTRSWCRACWRPRWARSSGAGPAPPAPTSAPRLRPSTTRTTRLRLMAPSDARV